MMNIAYRILAKTSDGDSVVLKGSSSVTPKSVQKRCFVILHQLKVKKEV